MHIDKDEIAVFQRMGNVLHLYQRAIVISDSLINDVRTYIMTNNHIRIGALLWIFVTNTNSGSIKEITDKEKIPTVVL
jgi:hypothetical protein